MAKQKGPPASRVESPPGLEMLISDLSTRFINLPPGEVDREIEAALRRVCEPFGIDYAVLWQWSGVVPAVIMPTHAFPAHEGPRLPEPQSQEQYPWTVRQMLAGRVVVLPSLEQLPTEAAVDRESARSIGIKSSLCLALSVGGEPPAPGGQKPMEKPTRSCTGES